MFIPALNGKPHSEGADAIIEFMNDKLGKNVRPGSAIGIKPVSEFGTDRLVRQAIEYAIKHNLPSVTLVHKGNIMKFTEGAFKNWGYEAGRGGIRRPNDLRRRTVG